ncbi:kinetochore protein fta4 [Pochonia chlamydosporia 170]|uniref:Kinetochore protein fta4 n=1 Tax=Pochonia chlamydosporia 170 TaxID=1380566 RepID=A0A179EZG4_METCM|nr:kinetochore protein fta4 [Pochonia chlamydosporia 170]OAQ58233.1 kinetochore protein fta4 [Pochonia chlamydosporia 170]
MADTAPTIPSLKESFISAQTNILSQPLAPSRIWRRNNNASSHPIPARILDDVLFNVNQTIQLHQRRVYPPQATYNVAEQISNLYSRDAAERVEKWKQSESNIGREQYWTRAEHDAGIFSMHLPC